jgi:ABC-type glycerol-3-phosphate transport system substrate-binding protein
MKTILTMTALAAALTLAGCGGSHHHDDTPAPPTTPTTPPVSMVDAFFTAVMGIIGDGKETATEPVATDAIVATKPDDTEPVVLK